MAGVRQNDGRSERLNNFVAFRPLRFYGNCGRGEARAQAQGDIG
jgi:hypothetical protein